MFDLNAEFIVFVAGAIISLLLWWAPGFAPLWAKVNVKRATLFALFLGIPLVIALLGCLTDLPIKVAVVCATGPNALFTTISSALWLGLVALAGNQGGYMVLLTWGADLLHSAHITQADPVFNALAALNKLNLTTEQQLTLAKLIVETIEKGQQAGPAQPPIPPITQAG